MCEPRPSSEDEAVSTISLVLGTTSIRDPAILYPRSLQAKNGYRSAFSMLLTAQLLPLGTVTIPL